MDRTIYDTYVSILKNELIPALGCTEPIAIAYASAKARAILGQMPDKVYIKCSGNIIKNVKSVIVPNSRGMFGIEASAMLGVVGGDSEKLLEVLSTITSEDIEQAKILISQEMCSVSLIQNVPPLHIVVEVWKGKNSASVTISNSHTNIVKIEKDGLTVFLKEEFTINPTEANADIYSSLNLKEIYEFACTADINDVKEILDRQIEMNTAVAKEGLCNQYGINVGATLLKYHSNSIDAKAKAMAAAGSDARMGGCSLPVVINSGSGNQGLTASLPVIAYADYLEVSSEKKYRALLLSNLIAIYQKRWLGRLSAYCGAVSAACGSGAAIALLYDESFEVISNTITNTLGNISGIVCDGAKASCAAKIASAVDAALMGYHLAKENRTLRGGDGIVKEDVEDTIKSVGRMGREGMKGTDIEILNIMLNR